MKLRLIEDWSTKLHQLWSIRLSIALGAASGVAGLLAAFTDSVNPWLLVGVGAALNGLVLPVLRLIKQDDTPPPSKRRRAKA